MLTANSRKTLNDFHYRSLIGNSTYINSKTIYKLKTLNVRITFKSHSIRATVPGYYVEWFYSPFSAKYTMIFGAEKGMVCMEEGYIDKLCDVFDQMFGYDV